MSSNMYSMKSQLKKSTEVKTYHSGLGSNNAGEVIRALAEGNGVGALNAREFRESLGPGSLQVHQHTL